MNESGDIDWKKIGDGPDSLMLKSRYAQAKGLDYFEVDQLLIDQMTNDSGATMMTYMNKKVYAYGKRDENEDRLNRTVNDVVFGGV